MEIKALNKNSFPSIRLNYNLDSTLNVTKDNFENEQNLDILLNNFLKEARDISSNKYSNFYLTDRKDLESNVNFKSLGNPAIEKFTTWLASDADKLLNTKTDFWTLSADVEGNITTIDVSASGIFTEITNRNIFDIEFLSEKICRISHSYNNYTRYLTINYLNATGNTFFCLNNGQDPFDPNSTQSFYYLYDRENDFIVIYKLINDISYIVYTYEVTKDITLFLPSTSDDFGFTNDQIYRCRSRFEPKNKPDVNSIYALYTKGFKNNNITINDRPQPLNEFCPSYAKIDTNFLINTEYYNLSDNTLPINVLTLKNTNTPQNYQSRNNPFSVKEPEIQQRQYRKIFTGSNQLNGYDNITLGYETFTSERIFPPDKLTYFHAPQDLFPYQKLNVNDTGLIESGAIAGDHPLRSDKLFKKEANYKTTSPFGDSTDEQSGRYLCTWLSGGQNTETRPVWIDRYYFPQKTTYISAFTAGPNPFVNYFSEVQGLQNELPFIKQVVVDIPSRCTFEPGVLYAYHHLGKKTVNQLIKNLNVYLYEKDLSQYTNTVYDELSGTLIKDESYEYEFNGNEFGKTSRVSSPEDFNKFTLNFYLYSKHWGEPFANQIVGNYVNDGFGIFNTNHVTPYIMLVAPSAIKIYNTDLEYVDAKNLNGLVKNVIRYDQCEDYFAILKNNDLVRINIDGVSLNKFVIPNIEKTKAVFPINDNFCFVLTGDASDNFFYINTNTGAISSYDNTGYLYDQANNVDFDNTGFLNILAYDGQVYPVQGYSPQLYGDEIYLNWLNYIFVYNTITKDQVSAYKFDDLIDLNIDFDGNLWALHSGNKISKLTTDNSKTLLSTFTFNLSGRFKNIDLLNYFENGEYKQNLVLYSRLSTNENYNKLRIDKIDYYGNVIKTHTLDSNLSAEIISDTTGGDYARYFTKIKYPKSNLNAKVKLRNVYDYNDTLLVNIPFDLSAFDVGYHHFALRLDTYRGTMTMFVDGIQIKNEFMPENNYIFNNILKEPFYAGASPSFNNRLLTNRLKQKNTFFAHDMKLKNLYLYDNLLDYSQINLHVKQGLEFYDMVFDIPSGRRNILEEIEFVFKNKVPGFKTGIFDLEIKNTGISDIAVKTKLELQIKQILNGVLPSYTKLRNIIWSDLNASQ